jgi:hypothetical protein
MTDHITDLIRHIRATGADVQVRGDQVAIKPLNNIPKDVLTALIRNKGALIAHLLSERSNDRTLFDHGVELEILRRSEMRIQTEGHVLIWSTLLGEPVYFCRDEQAADNAPRGIVAYTLHELETLFGETESSPSAASFQMIHQVKKYGGRVIDEK